jgi:hypothetical protein
MTFETENRSVATVAAAAVMFESMTNNPEYAEEFRFDVRDLSKDLFGFRVDASDWSVETMINWLTANYEFDGDAWSPVKVEA